jgi:UDP-3-O-[3-hydroxymyristoyl] glucosamine N-acyltransferase
MLEFSAQQIAMMIQGQVEGDASVTVHNFGKIEEATAGQITFLANPKYEAFLYTTAASIVIIGAQQQLKEKIKATLIRVPDAYAAFATLLTKYQELKAQQLEGIQSPSFIAPSAKIGTNHFIAAFAYINEGATLGDHVKIFPNVVIGENVKIGNHVTIHPGVVVYADCVIGNHVTIHSGSIIGSDGFGFAPKEDGSYQKVPQLGNVVIEDDVEIGSNCSIDRATMGSTYIRKGVKIDNLCQIAHNVDVDEHTAMAAQVGIAGSAKIGKYVMIGGQTGIAGHLHIADGTKIVAQSGIPSTVKSADTLMGSPAINHNDFKRSYIGFRKLPFILSKIQEFERQLKELTKK